MPPKSRADVRTAGPPPVASGSGSSGFHIDNKSSMLGAAWSCSSNGEPQATVSLAASVPSAGWKIRRRLRLAVKQANGRRQAASFPGAVPDDAQALQMVLSIHEER